MTENIFHKHPIISGASQKSQHVSESLLIPKQIGPYHVLNLLESGGMSVLYLGIHSQTKEPAAIKVLSQRFLSYPDVIRHFLNEAEIIGMTDHPNIVKLHEHGQWPGGYYIALEFIQGYSLRQMILRQPVSLKRALEIVIEISYALCHLHTHGVIHRDLKPENILITYDHQVKMIDFGIAQRLSEKLPKDAPLKQQMIGTPIYISPEQRENPESVSYASDIYSLGIIAYELVLGKLSQGHIHLSLMPKGLQKVFNKALQANPKDRYQDVVDFITDISIYCNSTAMAKEKAASDDVKEFLENVRMKPGILTPPKIPKSLPIDICFSSSMGMNHYAVYDDLFSFPDGSLGIFHVESVLSGIEGLMNISLLKGMIHSSWYLKTSPAKFFSMLNTLICNEKAMNCYGAAYFIYSPSQFTLTYVICGEVDLWFLSGQKKLASRLDGTNPLLGADIHTNFTENTLAFQAKDCVILRSFVGKTGELAEYKTIPTAFFDKILQESDQISLESLLNTVLTKTVLASYKSYREQTITLIGIKKT